MCLHLNLDYVFIVITGLVDTSGGGILVPAGSIHPVIGVSALAWFIRYSYD